MSSSFFKKRLSPIKPGDPIDYKDVDLLKKFITERGKILPRRLTGLTARQQRDLTNAVKRAPIPAILSASMATKAPSWASSSGCRVPKPRSFLAGERSHPSTFVPRRCLCAASIPSAPCPPVPLCPSGRGFFHGVSAPRSWWPLLRAAAMPEPPGYCCSMNRKACPLSTGQPLCMAIPSRFTWQRRGCGFRAVSSSSAGASSG